MTKANAGTLLCGRYRILSALGAGGMASVWRGEQVSTGLPVAIKIILRELLDAAGAVERFQSEAKAVAQLRSANVVRLIDYDVDAEIGPFIVMELLEGETLGARLARGERLSPPELLRLFKQIARGLDHAHQSGIVHRDLKPDNVFLARDERGAHVVKLVDFGVAKSPLAGRQTGLTSPGHLVGTIAYMSPEQALGKEVDYRSDLWALGIIAYECLVGQVPFDGDTLGLCLLAICTLPIPVPSAVSAAVPPEFDAWFARACERDPDGRFTSCAEMVAALAPICAAEARAQEKRKNPSAPVAREHAGDAPDDGAAVYYVTAGDTTVGPVSRDLLLRGMDAGRVPETALVWREGWPHWRAAALVRAWLLDGALLSSRPGAAPALRDCPGLEAIGARSMVPPSAPRSEADPHDCGPETPVFHVYDGTVTVGPLSGTVLCRGALVQLVPYSAMVWREGWNQWRRVADVVWELAGVRMHPGEPQSAPRSVRALGSLSMMPPGAPSTPPSQRLD